MNIIYRVTNKTNNKQYIGQTRLGLQRRRIQHKANCKHGKARMALYAAARKYGWDNFEWDILEKDVPIDQMNSREIYYISKYNTYNAGYNATKGGKQAITVSQETRQKMSIAQRGRRHTPEAKAKIATAAKGHTRNRGQKRTKEQIERIIASRARYWEIIEPSGNTIIIKNLKLFCRNNNLQDSKMTMVSQGKRNHHKGYTCKKLSKIYKG